MKKLLIVCSFALFGTSAFAQLGDFNIGFGVGVGTTGIDIDASATYGDYLGARFGVDIMPKIKVSTELDLGVEDKAASMSEITQKAKDLNTAAGYTVVDLSNPIFNNQLPTKMDVEGKLNNTTWHFLIDVYPFGAVSSFHATVGAYFGPSELISVYNKDDGFLKPLNEWNHAVENPSTLPAAAQTYVAGQKMIGAELGDYFITPNPSDKGNVEANIEVKSFRPYLGIGFGRAVPKGRIGCQFDLGVQFWGSPKVIAPTYERDATSVPYNDRFKDTELKESNAGSDAGKVLKTISKISVYPVLNFRLVGRIL
jgi:hypothetical protein